MRVVFMGTPDFAVQTLTALHAAGHEICLVVTQPDKPKGRHGELQKSPVRAEAERLGLEVITPARIRRDEEAKARLRALAPDVMVVTAFGQILPQEILDIPRLGCVNVHASLLPKYRGASPIQWAVINGDAESGITTMQMDAGVDTGDILLQRRLRLNAKETGGSLFDRLAALGGKLIVETLAGLAAGSIHPVPQDESQAVCVGMFTKESGRIDWKEQAAAIERRVRGLNPWPSAYTSLGGKTLKLWDTDVADAAEAQGMRSVALLGKASEGQPELLEEAQQGDRMRQSGAAERTSAACSSASQEKAPHGMFLGQPMQAQAAPGTLFTDGKRLLVRCGDGWLRLNELQLEGKKRMDAEAFLRGHRF